jgi:hypothetical protein
VHPQHERRKFLRPNPPFILAKFVGFGERGRTAFARSHILHDAGFIPAPLDLSNGFLFSTFVPGKPVARPTSPLARRIADYLNILPLSTEAIPFEALLEMIEVNLQTNVTPLRDLRSLIEDAPAYELDGRMLTHEWIDTAAGFLKTDAVDHCDDHFFPGPQDIAWDIAAAAIEFDFDDTFLDQFAPSIRRRVPFYKLAYSAFRLGYCRMAQNAVDPPDAIRFARLAARYETVTKQSPLIHHFV